ncbi:MAG: hypothetical protein ACUVWP_01055 [bacterium]
MFKSDDGTKEEEIQLNEWSYYMVGMSRGRDNYHNTTSETCYIACFYPSNL